MISEVEEIAYEEGLAAAAAAREAEAEKNRSLQKREDARLWRSLIQVWKRNARIRPSSPLAN